MQNIGALPLTNQQAKFGQTSIQFVRNSARYLLLDANRFHYLTDLTVSFTVEMWVFPNSAVFEPQVVMEIGDNDYATPSFYLYINAVGQLYASIYRSVQYGSIYAPSVVVMPLGQWSHIAIVYNAASQTLQAFVNGVGNVPTPRISGVFSSPATDRLTIGARSSGRHPLNSYLDDIRITKNVARYTSDFTPPTSTFPN